MSEPLSLLFFSFYSHQRISHTRRYSLNTQDRPSGIGSCSTSISRTLKMKSSTIYTVASLSSLLLLTNAFPLAVERRKPASYSVVAVDGGSTGDDTTTVTNAVTHTA